MKNLLFVNQIVQWNNNDNKKVSTERILWIDENNILAFVIDINSGNSLPMTRKINELTDAINDGIAKIIDEDPWINVIQEDNITEYDKKIRDEAWDIISGLVKPANEPDIYNRNKRGALVLQVVEEKNTSKNLVYKYLKKYWVRGKNKNALLPDFDRCGGKGKQRKISGKKLGRPRRSQEIIGEGINVDEETKQIFRIAISRYYNTTKGNPLTTAYNLMIKEFFVQDYKYENGVKKPIIKPLDEIPTITQFRYWYEKERNIKKEISSRKSAKKFELKHRAILGESTHEAMGPGALFQIDATIADVYLVSRYDRNWIIGRPIVYSIMDVFSRMITGIYIGLEGPSWIGAMMALANAATDKVSFCKEYGIEITEGQWMSHHIPQAILADRGEFEGKKVEGLINAFGIKISNTPPFRADWKGIIEQNFRVTNLQIKPFLPGFINSDFRERGGRDYRLDAKLDIYEFTQIIIKCVLYHNNEHWLKNYSREEMMISDDIECIPKNLWQWGILNRAGKLSNFPDDIVKLNLMPMDKATVTSRGIKFKNLYYGNDTALKEMWFEMARAKGSWKIDISYDPRNMNYIYIRKENGKYFEKCSLLERESRYKNRSIEEINYLVEYEKIMHKKNIEKETQSKVDLMSDIEAIVKSAEKKTKNVQVPGESKTSKLKGIRDNRKVEKERNRETESFELDKVDLDDASKIISLETKKENNNDIGDNEDVVDEIELLRRIQKEKLNGSKK